VHALAELIRNGVDADASHIIVEFAFKDLAQGMSEIVGYGDRQGIPRYQATQLSAYPEGSRGPLNQHTHAADAADQMVNRCEGRERDPFGLGGAVDWKVSHLAGKKLQFYSRSSIVEREETIAGGSYHGASCVLPTGPYAAGIPDAEIWL
jgi:hypothetical protein